jgi:hypothetical protein
MSGPIDPDNPYFPPGPRMNENAPTEEGFATFGNWHIQSLLAEVTTRALKAAWFQKWFVHRRLRPEALGGLIEANRSRGKNYPVHQQIIDELQDDASGHLGHYFVGPQAHVRFDTFLLPQAFPEGSPMHPSLPEGHATVAAACATILKAWFDESYVLEDPNKVNAAGTGLENYNGEPLTVGGELNKLVSNVSLGGRSGAGVHFRGGYAASLALGEEVAIGILEQQKLTYNKYQRFTLTKFDGMAITI